MTQPTFSDRDRELFRLTYRMAVALAEDEWDAIWAQATREATDEVHDLLRLLDAQTVRELDYNPSLKLRDATDAEIALYAQRLVRTMRAQEALREPQDYLDDQHYSAWLDYAEDEVAGHEVWTCAVCGEQLTRALGTLGDFDERVFPHKASCIYAPPPDLITPATTPAWMDVMLVQYPHDTRGDQTEPPVLLPLTGGVIPDYIASHDVLLFVCRSCFALTLRPTDVSTRLRDLGHQPCCAHARHEEAPHE